MASIIVKFGIIRYLSTHSLTRPRVVFSGIQPTGIPHLGNYLGAIQNWVQLQDTASANDKILYCIVGYHAITLPQDPVHLETERFNMLASLLACGIDPSKSLLYNQDQVPEHTELAWILNCITPMGWLYRMTTWKSKLAVARNANSEEEVNESMLNLGLLAYPVLQAADILLHKSTHIPVGEDQTQHLELAQDIARAFNHKFNTDIFPIPQQLSTPTKRVLSLRDPSQKMSKSAPSEKSRILITDDPAAISAKIRGAVTDSNPDITFDPTGRPGVSNLLSMLAACTTESSVADLDSTAQLYRGKQIQDLKRDVADAIIARVEPIRTEYERLRKDLAWLRDVSQAGDQEARGRVGQTMSEVKKILGLARH
ncbi:tryptophanyl-tRNA synthetase [Dacryopinax primogenitus]|uniref:Tryptophan--tRNA ligase, mitochondrial n=1 Tax=Dacryopinax primogenitus (strain DJM 731) TaxID=1858805 RepID=M5GBQ9_DACPD|nr:tryptophanyl-tRNA synthetase [Dacryopinax primogenitus]EJU05865.1 tryptophanyl-tRNA synthetase [Dacryopinax primogenitus]